MSEPSRTVTCHPAAAGASAMLEQCVELLERLSPDLYTRPSDTMFGASIGQHVRHSIDHFGAAIEADAETIDYDHRDRGTPIERDVAAAIARCHDLRDKALAIEPCCDDERVTIRVMLASDGNTTDLRTTRAREIAFAMHHAIHHNAMIAVIAREFGIPVPDGFGKAPSTLEFEAHA